MEDVRRFPIVQDPRVKGRGTYGMQHQPTLVIEPDGSARIPQEHGLLSLWTEDSRSIVLKEKGHKQYYNQYNDPWQIPTQFHVFLKLEDGSVIEVTTTPLRKSKDVD